MSDTAAPVPNPIPRGRTTMRLPFRCCVAWMPCASVRACISATPMTVPACITWLRNHRQRRRRSAGRLRKNVSLTLNGDGGVTVRDEAAAFHRHACRGRCFGGRSRADAPACRRQVHPESYKVSGGLHGVGAAVVNTLSEWMEVRIWRQGTEHFIRFHNGDAVAPLAVVGSSDQPQGTEVTFKPSSATFTKTSTILPCWNAVCVNPCAGARR